MYVGYTYDINMIVNSLVYFWRTLLLVKDAIETTSMLLLLCFLVLQSLMPRKQACFEYLEMLYNISAFYNCCWLPISFNPRVQNQYN